MLLHSTTTQNYEKLPLCDFSLRIVSKAQCPTIDLISQYPRHIITPWCIFFSEFWLGLKRLHALTETGSWILRVQIKYDRLKGGELSPRAGTLGIGEWEKFSVASEADLFKLSIGPRVKKENMEDTDPFVIHNGKNFTTTDRDHDIGKKNCAEIFGGGWWHQNCYSVCLNCQWADGSTPWRPTSASTSAEKISHSLMWIKQVAWSLFETEMLSLFSEDNHSIKTAVWF